MEIDLLSWATEDEWLVLLPCSKNELTSTNVSGLWEETLPREIHAQLLQSDQDLNPIWFNMLYSSSCEACFASSGTILT